MQSTVSRKRRVTGAVAALGAVLLTASCAAGQHASTAENKPAIDGSFATVKTMDLRGVAVLAPPTGSTAYLVGQAAPLTLVIINNGTTTDTLTSLSSPSASGFQVLSGNETALPSSTPTIASPLPASTAGSSGSSSSSQSSSTSSSSSSSSTAETSPSPSDSTATPLPVIAPTVQIAPGSRVSFGLTDSTLSLFLTSLRTALYSAAVITVTATFKIAGSVTFEVPVQLSTAPNSSTIPVPSGSGGE